MFQDLHSANSQLNDWRSEAEPAEQVKWGFQSPNAHLIVVADCLSAFAQVVTAFRGCQLQLLGLQMFLMSFLLKMLASQAKKDLEWRSLQMFCFSFYNMVGRSNERCSLHGSCL